MCYRCRKDLTTRLLDRLDVAPKKPYEHHKGHDFTTESEEALTKLAALLRPALVGEGIDAALEAGEEARDRLLADQSANLMRAFNACTGRELHMMAKAAQAYIGAFEIAKGSVAAALVLKAVNGDEEAAEAIGMPVGLAKALSTSGPMTMDQVISAARQGLG